MKIGRLVHIKVGASAAVVLATMVNAAAAGDQLQPPPTTTSDLSWAVRGDASHSVKTARVYFAKKAVKAIHSQDQLSGAQAAPYVVVCSAEFVPVEAPALIRPAQQPACSSHQPSAP